MSFEYDPHRDEGISRSKPGMESLEDVLSELEAMDDLLIVAGHLPQVERTGPAQDFLNGDRRWSNETEKQAWEQFAETMQEALGDVGLFNADELTAEALSRIDPEVLNQLDPLIAESLFFVASRRLTKWLGSEPIIPEMLLSHAEMLVRKGHRLEKIQLLQRASALERLSILNIDPEELKQLSSGKPNAQQTINRLDFFLFDEPQLDDYLKHLFRNQELEGPWGIEHVVFEAQVRLRLELNKITDRRVTDEVNGLVDTIYQTKYERTTHRIGSTISIGETILREMRNQRTENA